MSTTHQSPAKLKTIKRLTTMVKTLRGLTKIPSALPRPGSEAYRLGNALSAKDAQKRQEDFVKRDQFRADKAAIRYFVTVDDLQVVAERLHVRPTMVPSFIVFCESGFAVDWFPAPLLTSLQHPNSSSLCLPSACTCLRSLFCQRSASGGGHH